MKTINFLFLITLIFIFNSCSKNEIREELPGEPTSFSGNVKDFHRNLNISNFTIKLVKIRGCGVSGNLSPLTCTTEIASSVTDANGNYKLNFNFNLRNDESYRILLIGDGITNRSTDFVSSSNIFYSFFDDSTIIKGQNNVVNVNAWKPIKLKFNLTVINNNNPPLNTAIEYNNKNEFGTSGTYTNTNVFEIRTRPNSSVNIRFWYILNYNTSNPTLRYAPNISYQTNETDLTILNYTVDCSTF